MINKAIKLLTVFLMCTAQASCSPMSVNQRSINKAAKKCTHTYTAAHGGAEDVIIYEYEAVGPDFAKEFSCLTGHTVQVMKGADNSVGFHIKNVDTLMLFHFDFEKDMYILQTFSKSPDISKEGYILHVYMYVGARVAVNYLLAQKPIPNYPITAQRGIVPNQKALDFFNYLKTGQQPKTEQE